MFFSFWSKPIISRLVVLLPSRLPRARYIGFCIGFLLVILVTFSLGVEKQVGSIRKLVYFMRVKYGLVMKGCHRPSVEIGD